MDPRILVQQLQSSDRELQGKAYATLVDAAKSQVDWAYQIWDDLLRGLGSKDNRLRTIAAQLLCHLAKSDPDQRMIRDFDAILAVTKDEKFVTARHSLQAIWRIGLISDRHRALVLKGLSTRFSDCIAEKNCTLIRFDIQESLRKLHDALGGDTVPRLAAELIETESDLKYRRKYSNVWKNLPK